VAREHRVFHVIVVSCEEEHSRQLGQGSKMAYYQLEYDYPMSGDNDYYHLRTGLEFDGVDSWTMGKPFDKAPPNPIVIEMECTGPWPDATPPPMSIGGVPLMNEEMVAAFNSVPVSNLDTYPAILRDAQTGKEWKYFAFNVLGLVKAADMDQSEGENLDGEMKLDSIFTTLVIDTSKVGRQDIFRLMESGNIIISERAKKALDSIPFLKFVQVSP
jgi:hypothetical protein